MKRKDFDDFSFKAPQSQQSIGEIQSKGDLMIDTREPQLQREIRYRHLEQNSRPTPVIYDREINKKIDMISQELEENIKRRLELEKKLNTVQNQERHKEQREVFLAYNNNSYKSPQEEAKEYDRMNRKADEIDRRIKGNKNVVTDNEQMVERSKEVLLDYEEPVLSLKEQIIIPIIQHLSSKPKPIPVYTLPDQIKIQKLLIKATFPQLPKSNLEELKKQIQSLYSVHSPHSDIHYLLMTVYFHLKKFMKVRKNFEQIINFKTFNPKAYWIAAQAEFQMKNYQLCLKLTEDCMNKLQDKYLPRFIYLKAKSYQEMGNYVNSAICFSQLIKMKPKISEYYLQRGIIYHRIGYYKQSKEDFVTFGIMRPDAQDYIKEKVLCENNEHRKREYIALLAKMF